MAENFPNLGRDVDIQVHETKRQPEKFNSKQFPLWYIVIKLSKFKDKEKIFKSAKESAWQCRPWSWNILHAMEQLSPWATTTESVL